MAAKSTKLRARGVGILISSLVLICLGAAACSSPKADSTEPTPTISGPPSTAFPMPPAANVSEMGWTTAAGDRVTLAEQKGKVVVLDLYATWCEPCRQSIPHLIDLHDRYKDEGLILVGLNVGGPDDRVKVANFATELGITYPLGFPDKSLSDFLISDNDAIPQTYVFARDGRLVKRYIGYDESLPAQLEQLINSELATPPK